MISIKKSVRNQQFETIHLHNNIETMLLDFFPTKVNE